MQGALSKPAVQWWLSLNSSSAIVTYFLVSDGNVLREFTCGLFKSSDTTQITTADE